MNLALFIGLQATGKSTFYERRFSRTHVRVNLDMLKTRFREALIYSACLEGRALVAVDNTNLTRDLRERYIRPAQVAGYRIVGYFFESRMADALTRNAARPEPWRVPELAIRGSSRRLELPSRAEGFDELYFVRTMEGDFQQEEWNHEI